jgi:hypothetical protein
MWLCGVRTALISQKSMVYADASIDDYNECRGTQEARAVLVQPRDAGAADPAATAGHDQRPAVELRHPAAPASLFVAPRQLMSLRPGVADGGGVLGGGELPGGA